MDTVDRRTMLGLIGAAAMLPTAGARAAAAPITMWRDAGCGCCTEWAKRVEAAFGQPVRVIDAADMTAVKRGRGVPDDLRSCHTAMIDGLVVEGHVPPQDIKRLIARRGSAIGLAVPGMPAGSPGMDVGHDHKERFQVIAFAPGGKRSVFAVHG